MSDAKAEFLERSKEFWNPGKTQFWQDQGVDLVIDRREGYYLYDMDGRRLIDVHLNGGTYNLGHRNPELIADWGLSLMCAMGQVGLLGSHSSRPSPNLLFGCGFGEFTLPGRGSGEGLRCAATIARTGDAR